MIADDPDSAEIDNSLIPHPLVLWVAFVNMSAGKYLFFFFFFFFPLCNLVIIYTSSVDCSLLLFERDRSHPPRRHVQVT